MKLSKIIALASAESEDSLRWPKYNHYMTGSLPQSCLDESEFVWKTKVRVKRNNVWEVSTVQHSVRIKKHLNAGCHDVISDSYVLISQGWTSFLEKVFYTQQSIIPGDNIQEDAFQGSERSRAKYIWLVALGAKIEKIIEKFS